MERRTGNYGRIALIWLAVMIFRLFPPPFRVPNVEPLLASIMPIAARSSRLTGLVFAMSSILLYDLLTSGIGIWTICTALAFGTIALASSLYFKHYEPSRMQFVGFGVASTLFYDAITGLTIGPIVWHQSFAEAFLGQIPFTLLHLLGTAVFALVLSPVLLRVLASQTSPSTVVARV